MNTRKIALVAAIALAGLAPLAAQARVQAQPQPPSGNATSPQVNYRIIKQHVALKIAKDGSYTKTVSRVIQPLTLSGVEHVSQMQISYPANFAAVKILKAYTQTAGGKHINVASSAIFTQSTPSALHAPFLSDGTIKNVVFPSVAPGATIHLKYVEHFKHAYLPGVYAVAAKLAPNVPVKSASVSVTAPKSMALHIHARGTWSKHRHQDNGTTTLSAESSWSHVDFPPEDTAALTQYAPMVVIGTATDWKDVAQAYDRLTAKSRHLTPAIRQTAARAANGAHGQQAVSHIYRWLQKHVQVVNVDYHEAGYQAPSAASTLARGMGDSNASANLLCSLLQAEGIKAEPALISTAHRFVAYPGADAFAFNHVLVYVPKYHLYLDTSERYAGINALPLKDAGRPVLLAGPADTLTHTPAPARGDVEYREVQNMTLNTAGVIRSDSRVTASGWGGIALRKHWLGDKSGARLQSAVQTGYYGSGHTGTIKITDISHRYDLNRPVSLHMHWRNNDAVMPGQRMALVLPTPGRIAREMSSFIGQKTRHYPSVLKPGTIVDVVHLHLPAGMHPVGLPKNETFKAPFGRYHVSYHYANGTLDVTRRLQLTRFIVTPKNYPKLHQLAQMAVNASRKGFLLEQSS
ncbi:DUF3857 domain-containing protein [Salinisphaera sp. RV14]|uniref:DUF3857 domain-containing protein n=1 Tax=Salinisphaera sp. RV14 TaxID=3454140 RepID=UPI003F852F74